MEISRERRSWRVDGREVYADHVLVFPVDFGDNVAHCPAPKPKESRWFRFRLSLSGLFYLISEALDPRP